ncbi:hypothetical protein RUM43_007840 [Polyplax serrata]|uniref:DALR anticodon binding domain-containing protein n=1 Tax=Polyplax serrata TaxID=468196 RepID=A0AAN8PNA8_POLSC
MAGYEINDKAENIWLQVSTKNQNDGETGKPVVMVCGPILNADTGRKETEMTANEYRRLRLHDLQIISADKNTENPDGSSLEILAEASVKLTLLQVKATQSILLNLTKDFSRNRETASKGATFILYNVSRLAVIRKKYFRGVANQVYPALPPVEDIDFSVLSDSEEWALLFNYLLEYPSLIKRCAEDIIIGRPAVHNICKFLLNFCSVFSVYYRRNRILLESKQHLLPIVQARLMLAMAIEQVLENGLTLLSIEKIEEM